MVSDLDLGDRRTPRGLRVSTRAGPAQTALAWIVGGFAAMGALVLGSILAVVFAATLAFALVVAAVLMTLMAVTWRFRRPQPQLQPAVIDARKVGHSWVAYGWDRQS